MKLRPHVTTGKAQSTEMRTRIVVAALVGLASGTFCWFLLQHTHRNAADFNWALWGAQDLLAHRNPYHRPMQLYPLPSALFALPLVSLRPSVAGGVFYGISSALLAFGITRHGYHRLLIFLAYPYWGALFEAQWPTLILAGAFLPLLLPAALAKPQLGIPILLTTATRRGLFCCVIVIALTFFLMPGWPRQWLAQIGQYSHFYPFLIFPGPLLALALLRFRHRDARLLFISSIMPQRWFYDAFLLWFIPKSRREIVWTSFISWAAGIWRWYHMPTSFTQVGRVAVLCFYLPMLAVLLLRPASPATGSSQLSV